MSVDLTESDWTRYPGSEIIKTLWASKCIEAVFHEHKSNEYFFFEILSSRVSISPLSSDPLIEENLLIVNNCNSD